MKCLVSGSDIFQAQEGGLESAVYHRQPDRRPYWTEEGLQPERWANILYQYTWSQQIGIWSGRTAQYFINQFELIVKFYVCYSSAASTTKLQ
jgi:hypothetical protein